MPSKNAVRCKRYRDSQDSEERKLKDRERKKAERKKLREDKEKYEAALRKDRERKAAKKTLHHDDDSELMDATPSTQTTDSQSSSSITSSPTVASTSQSEKNPFGTKQAFYRSKKSVEKKLPRDPTQKVHLLSTVVAELSPNKREKVMENLRRKPTPSVVGRKPFLSEEKGEFLLDFLRTPGISYTMPGKNDTVYVGKEDGKRQYRPKHYLLFNIRELTDILNRQNDPDAIGISFYDKFGSNISFSTVYRFVKKQKEIFYQSDIPIVSCLCAKCENMELLVEGIRMASPLTDLPQAVDDILMLFTCADYSRTCAYSNCTNCPSPTFTHLDEVEEVNFYGWEVQDGKKYPEKVQKCCTGKEAGEHLIEQIAKMKVHSYLKRKQFKCYQAIKTNLKTDELLIHVDFSENYDNRQRNAIQSAYFGYQSFSLYTVCVYFRPNSESDISCKSYVLINGTTDHTGKTVYALNKFLLTHLNDKHAFNTVHFFSDGASCQFRSKQVFSLLSMYDKSIKLRWHFFETSHGKGPVDGVGGVVKSVVHKRVMSGHVVIGSPKQFAEYADTVVKGVTVLYVPDEEMNVSLCDDPPKVPGTLQVRYIERVITNENTSLSFYMISPESGDVIGPFRNIQYNADGSGSSTEASTVQTENRCNVNDKSIVCVPGQWYAAYCAEYSYWFVGHVIEVNEETQTVKLDFLEQKTIGVNVFLMTKKDVETVDCDTVFYKLKQAPVPISTTRFESLCFSDEDFAQIQDIFAKKYR